MKQAVLIYADGVTYHFESIKQAALSMRCSRNQLDSALKSESGLVYIRKRKACVYIDYALPFESDVDGVGTGKTG